MRLRNHSIYPTDEVRELVEFGMKGVRTERLYVRVKNTDRGSTAGMAYKEVPDMSPVSGMVTADHLITIRIGKPSSFPDNNVRTYRRWQKVSEAEYQMLPEDERRQLRHWTFSDGRAPLYQREIVESHPYGGKRSPLIEVKDWREGLVTIAAHEARHIHQFRYGKPRSEVDAERFAAKRLAAWREQQGG